MLKATVSQYNALNGYTNGVSVIEFAIDADGDYVIGEGVLSDPAFVEILPQLELLQIKE